MKAAVDRFIIYLKDDRARAKNTIVAYSTDVRQFDQVITASAGSAIQPEELRPNLVEAYAHWLERQGYRPSTVSRKMAASRAFLIYLEEQEKRISPPIHDVLKPPPAPRSSPSTLSKQQVSRLLNAPTQVGTPRSLRDAAILALLYSGGLRASEAVESNLSDVDLTAGTYQRHGEEPVSLNLGVARESMQSYLRAGRPYLAKDIQEQALFLNLRGKRLSRQGLWLVVKRWAAAEELGDDISPHTLRHSLIRHLLDEGMTKREIQHLLGLSSPNAIRVGQPAPA